jgi:hypothetical protein
MDADTQPLLAELARVKALFQARAIAAVIGTPPPVNLPDTTAHEQAS